MLNEWGNRKRELDVADLVTPDFVWHTRENLPDAGGRNGPDGLVQLRAEWMEVFDDFDVAVDELIDAGDQVVSVTRLCGRIRGSGNRVELPETQVWTMRDGKAVEVRAYLTRAEALEAVGLAG
jgi:ketosteroid isomerase-like protein